MLDTATELHLTKLLASIAEYKAADLHLTVANPPMLRIGQQVQALSDEPLLTNDFMVTVAQALLTPQQWQQFELKRDCVVTVTLKGKQRYRLHVYSQQGSTSLTFRLIPTVVQSLSRQNLPKALADCLMIRQGLIVIAGEYGSGKSTVLAGFIEEYNQTRAEHIMTFEQPIEYIYNDSKAIIEQVSLGEDLPDLESALPRIYQEDVSIIVVSTLLDAVTIRTILQFVRMGKLVLLELTAPNVQAALESLVDVFHATEQIAVREELSTGLQAVIALQPRIIGGQTLLACEVLRRSTAVVNFIKHESFDKIALIIENGRADGMVTFDQSIT